MFYRGRRLRTTSNLRDMVRETHINPEDLIQPYFVVETNDPGYKKEIPSMPGQFQRGIKSLLNRLEKIYPLGLRAIILFGIPKQKDEKASSAYDENGIIQQCIKRIKDKFPDLIVITDVCLCEYMSHGHCGIVKNGHVENDPTLELLAKTALSHVKAGCDMVAPSDMMDGRIKIIRQALDQNGFKNTPIMSYAVKYASSFYGPFREAAESAPKFGDRRSYQMDPANKKEAIREARADIEEGADIIMVKPALAYLDIISTISKNFPYPIAAYQVSGEYSQIKAAAKMGWIDHDMVMMESLIGIKRAGADLILSYFTEEILKKRS